MNPQVTVTRRNALFVGTALAASSALGAEVSFAPSSAIAQTALSAELGKLRPLPEKLSPSVESACGQN